MSKSVTSSLENLKSVKLAGLFEKIRSSKRLETVPDEIVPELREAETLTVKRGGAHGEDEIYTACQELLEGDSPVQESGPRSTRIISLDGYSLWVLKLICSL